MKNKIINIILSASTVLLLMTSCNKELEQFPSGLVTPATGPTLDQLLSNNPDDSLYYRMLVTAGMNNTFADSTKSFTIFAIDNLGMKRFISALSGGALNPNLPNFVFSNFISNLYPSLYPYPDSGVNSAIVKYKSLISYNTVPQKLLSSQIGATFPNFIYPTILEPIPGAVLPQLPGLGPVIRLAVYPSTENGPWLNNVPITGVDQLASNGVIHHIATLNVPSQRYLWDRISTDPELTYLKAAVERADSGVVGSRLQDYLSTFGPDFTVFAPVDSAFKVTLTGLILQGLIAQGLPLQLALPIATQLASTPNVFNNPALASALSPTNVKGIVVYHVLGKRAYTNNFPTIEPVTGYPTLLNSGVPSHPGLKLKATFGVVPPFVAAATVKDVYNNSPAANIIINASPLTPDPNGTSDQQYINGVLHKIDRVLLPQ